MLEQQEMLQEVGADLLGGAPEGWVRLEYEYSSVARYATDGLTAEYSDGTSEMVKCPVSVLLKLAKLRAGMYQEDKGTWFSIKYTIERPSRYSVDFNYDEYPNFTFRPSPEDFVDDLETFPRSDEFVPDWLREQIEAARGGAG
ncbi:hypothetical protein ACFWTE_09355 [Nocardiopsis sp. NPDC058631]|uniref:hypothetical protein n=1 Tax=Nocardiopsis sp. NPDC058631 TaxID=3346566 RepID=UPI00365EA027